MALTDILWMSLLRCCSGLERACLTVPFLQQILNRTSENWDAILPKRPRWRKHQLGTIKRSIREMKHLKEAAIDATTARYCAAPRSSPTCEAQSSADAVSSRFRKDDHHGDRKGRHSAHRAANKKAYAIPARPSRQFRLHLHAQQTNPRTKVTFVRGKRSHFHTNLSHGIGASP